jgi:hypothetical protein
MEDTNDNFKLTTDLQPIITLTPTPFSVTFSWKGNAIKVELVNGEDILKLADMFSKVLTENNIEHKIIK